MVCGVSLRYLRKLDRWRTKQELAGLKKYNIQKRALKIFQEAWTTIQWRLLKEISGKFSLASSGCVQLFKNKTTEPISRFPSIMYKNAQCNRTGRWSAYLHSCLFKYIGFECVGILHNPATCWWCHCAFSDTISKQACVCLCAYISAIGVGNNLQR